MYRSTRVKVQGFYLDFTWGDGKRGSTMPDDTASRPVRPGALAVTEGLAVDGLRVVVLTVAYVFCLVGALAAFGVIPDPAPNLSSVLTAEASLLGTAPEAERLWWVALVGLGCYVVWMWFRPGVNERRARAIAYPAAATLALLGTWFFVVRADLTLGAVVALAVVAALIVTLHVADRVAIDRFFGRQLTQLGAAVTLGWMSVLAAETVAAALAARHVRPPYLSSETWGILAATALMAYGHHPLPARSPVHRRRDGVGVRVAGVRPPPGVATVLRPGRRRTGQRAARPRRGCRGLPVGPGPCAGTGGLTRRPA